MPATKKQSVSQNEVSNDTQTVKEATGMSVEDMLAMIANLTAQVNNSIPSMAARALWFQRWIGRVL